MEWFQEAFDWKTPYANAEDYHLSAEEITHVYEKYLKATTNDITSALQFYSNETLFTILVSLFPFDNYLQSTFIPASLNIVLGNSHMHAFEYYTNLRRLDKLSLATIIGEILDVQPNADISMMSIGILSDINIKYLSTLDLLKFMIAFHVEPTIPMDRDIATGDLLMKYNQLGNHVSNDYLQQMLVGEQKFDQEYNNRVAYTHMQAELASRNQTQEDAEHTPVEYTPVYRSPNKDLGNDRIRDELLHPNIENAVIRLIPTGKNFDSITQAKIPIGAFYFQCTNPQQPHYFNISSIQDMCNHHQHSRFGNCTKCIVCGYEMNPILYQNGEGSLQEFNEELANASVRYHTPTKLKQQFNMKLTPKKLF